MTYYSFRSYTRRGQKHRFCPKCGRKIMYYRILEGTGTPSNPTGFVYYGRPCPCRKKRKSDQYDGDGDHY